VLGQWLTRELLLPDERVLVRSVVRLLLLVTREELLSRLELLRLTWGDELLRLLLLELRLTDELRLELELLRLTWGDELLRLLELELRLTDGLE